jgi:methionyl-tRNA synthetase
MNFVKDGMEDFSISRSKKRLSWGIAIPGDETQVMYVWFGAFINYISTLGWPDNKKNFEKFWQNGENIQTAGKDMVKFQSVMWQGMLMSADISTTQTVVYHGFVTGEGGIKMSKSLGNVINPNEVVKEYGTDALRYFLLREISSFEDSPFTMERFKDAYNANLANGLGNLVSRILTLSEKYLEKCPEIKDESDFSEYFSFFEKFDVKQATDYIWREISLLDGYIQANEPFKVVKTDQKRGEAMISYLVVNLYQIARMLNPIMPETNVLLKKLIKENKKPAQPLFPRKD